GRHELPTIRSSAFALLLPTSTPIGSAAPIIKWSARSRNATGTPSIRCRRPPPARRPRSFPTYQQGDVMHLNRIERDIGIVDRLLSIALVVGGLVLVLVLAAGCGDVTESSDGE